MMVILETSREHYLLYYIIYEFFVLFYYVSLRSEFRVVMSATISA